MSAIGTGRLLNVFQGCSCLYADVLIDLAACDDIHHLHAAANAQHGQIFFQRLFADAHFVGISEGIDLTALVQGFFSEQQRVDIAAACQEQTIQKIGQFLMREQGNGCAACFFDGQYIILVKRIFFRVVRVIRRNADDRFSSHFCDTPFEKVSLTVYRRRRFFAMNPRKT